MKVNIKTLKGTDFFDLTIEETTTVAELKDRIATEKSKDRDTIKLVHKGKQLNDDTKTMRDHEIKENDFIILMFFVKKATEETKPVVTETATSTTATTTASTTNATTSQTTATTATSVSQSGSDLVQGAELEEKIKEMESMGFERPRILQALKAAYNNPERAIDYLLSGNIPQIREGGQASINPLAGSGGTGGVAGNPGLEQLQQLQQNPQFQQIAQAIRQNPALLQPVMQQLAQTNPDVARLLQQNPQAFLNLLLNASENEGGQTLPPNAIQITAAEKADIDEIISLGFDKNDALEAYITCDKQKELAINYLFDARESGALLSEHISREELQAAQDASLNPNPPQGPDAPMEDEEEDDDDDFMYQ